MKKLKLAITATVANLNYDGSGSAAELFLQRTLRVPGLAHIPTHLINADKEKASRAQSREKQVAQTNKQRRPDLYENGQKVVLQNNVSKLWNIRVIVPQNSN